jgi:hypothetical protein
MANQNPDGKQIFWYEGVTTSAITTAVSASIGTADYWYNGSPQGFIFGPYSATQVKTRSFAVLINF